MFNLELMNFRIPTYTVMLEEATREKCKTIIVCDGLEATGKKEKQISAS